MPHHFSAGKILILKNELVNCATDIDIITAVKSFYDEHLKSSRFETKTDFFILTKSKQKFYESFCNDFCFRENFRLNFRFRDNFRVHFRYFHNFTYAFWRKYGNENFHFNPSRSCISLRPRLPDTNFVFNLKFFIVNLRVL
jgi:hypothetical protein